MARLVRPLWRTLLSALLLSSSVLVAAHTIKHVIVVMEENRSFDHLLGWRKGVDGLVAGRDCNYRNPLNKSLGQVCVNQDAKNVAVCDPNHDLPPTTFKIYGPQAYYSNNLTHPDMSGFAAWESGPNGPGSEPHAASKYCGVMDMFSTDHLPVMNGIADHFTLFQKFYASIPGPTWPNRVMFLAGSSGGLRETSNPWYLGQTGQLFPLRTIFDQVQDAGLTWKNYVNDTPWELFMESVAHNAQNVVLMDQFWKDCREGTLPNFAFINPRAGVNLTHGYGSNDHHPDHDIALGEAYYKDIYEAMRISPQWNDSLLILTYDEHGGFYDHVPPPQKNVPAPGDGNPSYPDNFSFDRLGMRIATLLMGPWVPKGTLIDDPPPAAQPTPHSKYDLTSIMSTVRKILGIKEGPLTKRDAWAATFEHVFDQVKEPRTDCPMHLPDAMKPTVLPQDEAELPLNSIQKHLTKVHAHLAGLPHPQHTKQGEVSEWLQGAFHLHKKLTSQWRESKHKHGGRPVEGSVHHRAILEHRKATRSPLASAVMDVLPQQSKALGVYCEPFIGQTPKFLASNWTITFNNTAPFRTISIPVAVSPFQPPQMFCLDAGDLSKIPMDAPAGEDLSSVGISLCYPSPSPAQNRDKSQQWIHHGASFRPASRPDLCLTSMCLAEANSNGRLARPATLQRCQDVLQQHWSWQGPAAGNVGYDDEGMLSNGDAIFALVIDVRAMQKAE